MFAKTLSEPLATGNKSNSSLIDFVFHHQRLRVASLVGGVTPTPTKKIKKF